MSYSFNIRAASKANARERAAQEFDSVVASQPVHAQDRTAALAALDAYLDLLVDDATRDIIVSVNGSVSYDWAPDVEATAVPLTNASVGVGAYLAPREAAE
jgi:hypothetical protein